jgi:hypothetical protein
MQKKIIVVDVDGTLYKGNVTDQIYHLSKPLALRFLIFMAISLERRMIPVLRKLRFLWLSLYDSAQLEIDLVAISNKYDIKNKVESILSFADEVYILSAQSENTLKYLFGTYDNVNLIGTRLNWFFWPIQDLYGNKTSFFEELSSKFNLILTIGDSEMDCYLDVPFIRVSWGNNENVEIHALVGNIQKVLFKG